MFASVDVGVNNAGSSNPTEWGLDGVAETYCECRGQPAAEAVKGNYLVSRGGVTIRQSADSQLSPAPKPNTNDHARTGSFCAFPLRVTAGFLGTLLDEVG